MADTITIHVERRIDGRLAFQSKRFVVTEELKADQVAFESIFTKGIRDVMARMDAFEANPPP